MSIYELVPFYPNHVLKQEYQEMYDDWYENYDGCSCHINPPCSYCTHEGNPIGLNETAEAWENQLIAEVRRVAESNKDRKNNSD